MGRNRVAWLLVAGTAFAASASAHTGGSFEALFVDWLERHAKVKKKSWQHDADMYRRHVHDRMGRLIAADMKRADVAAVLRQRSKGVLTVFGGYVSVPAAMGAQKVAMPYANHEQNAVPGIANRFVARRAERTFVAFAPALERLKDADVVGNPLDRSFEDYNRDQLRPSALGRYGLDPDRPVVGIVGGSLGAQALN